MSEHSDSSLTSEELAEMLEKAIASKDIEHSTLWGRDLLQAVWANLDADARRRRELRLVIAQAAHDPATKPGLDR